MLKFTMCVARCVLAMMALHVGAVYSWDIAISVKDQLIFYTNGTRTGSINLISRNPTSLVYDEVHNMMLYVDKQNNNDSVCGYDLSSKHNKCFIKRYGHNIHGLAFDPVTERIFFTDTNESSINWFSLKPGYNNSDYGNLLIKIDSNETTPTDIAVDSCGGYVYWTHNISNIDRARLNGSERRLIFANSFKQFSIVMDPQTQNLYYFDICGSCSDGPARGYLNKKIINTTGEIVLLSNFFGSEWRSRVLTVSKDYLYWKNSTGSYDAIWRLSKNAAPYVEPTEINKIYDDKILGITAKYKIKDQVQGVEDCDSLSSLVPTLDEFPDYTSEQCNVSACDYYCVYGNCSINDEGLPKCSCNAGYSGQRCEVNVCHNYCLNDGVCSLNEEDEPVCQCAGNHEGPRCEADISDTTTNAPANTNLTNMLLPWRKSGSKIV
ncbi:hypothetical protein PYW07_014005 [Mythimna separata]|uniref:Protein cueball n=1 Tax=Mythimna separata TaxID=271217 RepID=A0AAD7YFS4_MYTSE|nr:hypothetical protein PYW07_014005 [Mythimna separata]